jgi:hypothetical protein
MALALIPSKLGSLSPPIASGLNEAYLSALSDVRASSKAQAILEFLRSSSTPVGILIIDGSAGVDSMHIAPSGLTEEATKRFTGGVAVVNISSPMTIKGSQIPIGVSLIHELGHAKQCIENPQWYEDLSAKILRNNSIVGEGKLNALKTQVVDQHASLKGLKFPQQKLLKPKLLEEFEAEYGNGPRRTLENDNLARHEKPVLIEMRLPFRDDYFNN